MTPPCRAGLITTGASKMLFQHIKRLALFVLVNALCTFLCYLIIPFVLKLFGIDIGGSRGMLLFFFVYGMMGSAISVVLSKPMVKRSYGVRTIAVPRNEDERWLVETVKYIAGKKGVKMPEVGIWQSSEVNAFATGWNRDGALVAVSSAILSRMDRNELKAVLGHELSHVANGDMVTMGIIQGIINAFVLWLSVLVASMLSGRGDRDGRAGSAVGYYVIQPVLQIVFGLFGTIVVRWFSRWREYRADAGSAAVYGKAPMIAALRALGAGPSPKQRPDGTGCLCINDGFSFTDRKSVV